MRPSVFPQIGDRLFDFWGRVCGVGIETQDALDNRLFVLLTSSASKATRNLQAALRRRRFLTIELALHVLGELFHYSPLLAVQFLGPTSHLF